MLGGFVAGPFALLSSFFSIGVAFYAIAPLGWLPPVMVVGFFIITSILVRIQMNPITRLTFIQQRYEGDFRFLHTRLRTFAEVILRTLSYTPPVSDVANMGLDLVVSTWHPVSTSAVCF